MPDTDPSVSSSRKERYPGSYAKHHPDRLAVVGASSDFRQTYRDLDAAANRLARWLASQGLEVGDHVSVLMENHPRFLEVLWGCHYAGLVYTAVSSRLTPQEVAYLLEDSECKALVTTSYLLPVASEAVSSVSSVGARLVIDDEAPGFASYDTAVTGHSAEPSGVNRVAGSPMFYSSGTSGSPKAVVQKRKIQPLETAPVGSSYAAHKVFGFDESTILLSTAPLYHAGPLGFALAANALGGTVVVMERFDPETFLKLVDQWSVTNTFVVPTMMRRIMQLPTDTRRKYATNSLRSMIHAAAPCPVPLKESVIEWFGPVVVEFYGGTEANGMAMCDSQEWLTHKGTVGRPIECKIHICDESGAELPVGETGIVYFESGGLEFEYRNDAEKTQESRGPSGWTTLRDVGHLDADGYLYLTDRLSNMIISGGVNIYPQEIENHLSEHPDVADVAVIGIPHEDFGEQVLAVVQPRGMTVAEAEKGELEQDLIAYCRSELADLKCPRRIEFRDELPREPTGKLLKRKLKDEYWGEGESRI